jgi:hypothetical protein
MYLSFSLCFGSQYVLQTQAGHNRLCHTAYECRRRGVALDEHTAAGNRPWACDTSHNSSSTLAIHVAGSKARPDTRSGSGGAHVAADAGSAVAPKGI